MIFLVAEEVASSVSFGTEEVLCPICSCVLERDEEEVQLDDRDCCSNEAARRCASPIVVGSNWAMAVWSCDMIPLMKRETNWN